MNYDDPDLLDALAAEYVIGTLRGPARRRFARLLRESVEAREAVEHWEALLGGLATVLPAVPPPARVWRRLEARLFQGAREPAGARLWRLWSLAATAAALVLAVLLVWQPSPGLPEGHVAIVSDAADQPQWVITADPATGSIRARAVNARAEAIDRAYELWMLPADGPPRSLGLLPVNGAVTRHQVSPALLALLRNAKGLAISLEPAGGSPTGAPTGPVLYQAPIVDL